MPRLRTLWLPAIALIVGAALGAAAMLVAFPFLFPPPAANEAAPQAQRERAGVFVADAPSRDKWHWADGSASLWRDDDGWVLRLEGDFRAGPGPDYHVYLNSRPTGSEDAFLADKERRLLARLRAFEGGQNYRLPAGFDPANMTTATIWCEQFSEYIGHADLVPAR